MGAVNLGVAQRQSGPEAVEVIQFGLRHFVIRDKRRKRVGKHFDEKISSRRTPNAVLVENVRHVDRRDIARVARGEEVCERTRGGSPRGRDAECAFNPASRLGRG